MMWLVTLLLTLALSLPTGLGNVAVADAPQSCSTYHDYKTPPKTIRVFRIHHKGSNKKARIEVWDFKEYVASVMASGAWPNRRMQSAKAGAIVIKQYAWWMVLHHQPGHSYHGRCYDITDSEQYLRDVRIPKRSMKAVEETWRVSLRKHGRFFRTGWSGGYYRDGWHLGEESARVRAGWGWGWQHILRNLLGPDLKIVLDKH